MAEIDIEIIKNTMRSHKICVLIPTYNNEGTLSRVISDVLCYTSDVIVVNDGSTDETLSILSEFGNKIDVVSYEVNKGKGAALKAGFRYALDRGFDYVITIDSDGQHYAEDIPNFVKAIVEFPGSLVVGARDLSKVDINSKSSFANKFSNFWFRLQTGKKLKDTQTGYRAYPLKKLYGMSILTARYEAELELLVFAAWHDVTIVSIPIKIYYPPESERISHFKPVADFTRISILNTFLCVATLVYGLPSMLINRIKNKNLFKNEIIFFTKKKGERRDAGLTLGRIGRSLYGLTFFILWAFGLFIPYALVCRISRKTEKKRYRLHKMLRWISKNILRLLPATNVQIIDDDKLDWDRPSIMVCNHQSHLDLPLLMSLNSKIVILTKDWVWHHKIIGPIVQEAEFLPVSMGIETLIPRLKDIIKRGYSIVVFPEGTRTDNDRIQRFHQGAFYLAQALNVDIQPIVIHGVGYYQRKSDIWFRKGDITLKVLNRISQAHLRGVTLRRQASLLRNCIITGYNELASNVEKTSYYKSLVKYRFVYRGWWTMSLCKEVLGNRAIEDYIDKNGKDSCVCILNSGVGVFALLYALVNKHCQVYAFEEDLNKHRKAMDTADLPDNLHFVHSIWGDEVEAIVYDKTICLVGPMSGAQTCRNSISIPIKS